MVLNFFDDLRADVAYAVRWLQRSPGFATAAILSLALGIGANAAIFNLMNVVLLRDLPVRDPEQLVVLVSRDAARDADRTFSFRTFQTFQRGMRALSNLFALASIKMNVDADGQPTPTAAGQMVSGSYFVTLGVPAVLGRTILPADDAPGAPRVVMVSHRYWTRELGSTPDVIGRFVHIRGSTYTIVGVTPRWFNGMVPVLAPELWIPVSASLDVEPVGMRDTIPSPTGTTRLDRRADR